MIPAAKATERTSNEDFASLKSIAKQNGGYYNRFAKRFLFKDGAGRDAFAQAAEREVFGGAQPQAVNNMETATPVATANQEQRAAQTSLQKQPVGEREGAEPEGKQLAKIIQKHPEQADAYRIALAGAPDYHGFIDDLRPGAIRQIRSVLEAVGSPFGAGKGSMPVKRLMESLARSPYTKESTKETSTGAVQYMLNGNRVPKAAYKYYQHLKSIGYSEEQDGNKKAADQGGRSVEEIKQSLVELANRAWRDSKTQGRVSFAPSKKLRDKVQELFGHDIDEVFITADDMRHIKNDHGANEEKRGQVNITSDEIAGLYDTVNDFNSAAIQKADSKGNKKLLVVRGSNGKSYSLLIERGKHKAEVKAFYKYKEKTSPMSDAHSPERNVQNDSEKSSSTPSVAQDQESGKGIDAEAYKRAGDVIQEIKSIEQAFADSGKGKEDRDRAIEKIQDVMERSKSDDEFVGNTASAHGDVAIHHINSDYEEAHVDEIEAAAKKAHEEEWQRELSEYHGFLDGKSKVIAGRIKKLLSKKIRSGAKILTRKQWIENTVQKDGTYTKIELGKYYAIFGTDPKNKDVYITVTKTEYEYFNYLRDRQGKEAPEANEIAVDSAAAKKGNSIFGSVEDADREMLDVLGLSEEDLSEDVLEAPPGISNTAEERERLEKELAAELNKISANPVFNPKIYTLGLKLAMTYVKDGYNTFKKLVTKLHAAFGDKIGPWAPALAETVRTWPKGVPFDEKKVMAISKAVGARYEGGITTLDEMQADMKKLLKGQHKSFAP